MDFSQHRDRSFIGNFTFALFALFTTILHVVTVELPPFILDISHSLGTLKRKFLRKLDERNCGRVSVAGVLEMDAGLASSEPVTTEMNNEQGA